MAATRVELEELGAVLLKPRRRRPSAQIRPLPGEPHPSRSSSVKPAPPCAPTPPAMAAMAMSRSVHNHRFFICYNHTIFLLQRYHIFATKEKIGVFATTHDVQGISEYVMLQPMNRFVSTVLCFCYYQQDFCYTTTAELRPR